VIWNNLTKKTIFHGASLAVVLLISTTLVSACHLVICNNGIETNGCAVESNIIIAQRYFNFSLAICIVVLILYFIRKRKGILTVIFCFISVTLPMFLRFLNGGEECAFVATQVAKWLFYFSMIAFSFQLISWIIQLRKSKIKLQ